LEGYTGVVGKGTFSLLWSDCGAIDWRVRGVDRIITKIYKCSIIICNMEEERIQFMKIFNNLPEKVRSEDIVVVIDDKPYTWNAAFIEVKNDTSLGKDILIKLKSLEIL